MILVAAAILHPYAALLRQAGKGSATLSMAYAAAEFAAACLRALAGEPGVVECAYVESHLTELPYFASPVRLGRHGVEARARGAVLACCVSGSGLRVSALEGFNP